jgi:hypothetical protein
MNTLQECIMCKNKLELSKISKDKSRTNGYDTTCKGCKKLQRLKRIEKLKEQDPTEFSYCRGCEQTKEIKYFDKKNDSNGGVHTECKDCKLKKRQDKKKENLEKSLPEDYKKKCNNCNNKKHKSEFNIQIYSTDGIGTICKECYRKIANKWRAINKKIVQQWRKNTYPKLKERYQTDEQFRSIQNIRNRIRGALRRTNSQKYNNSIKILNCSPKEFKDWLEYQFDSNMSWDNQGTYWEIDHVIPCSFFDINDEEEQNKCFNWRNCRPLEKIKNRSKNNKIDDFQILLQEIRVNYYKQHAQIAGIP